MDTSPPRGRNPIIKGMNLNQSEEKAPKFLLALHSSSDTFGVAVLEINKKSKIKSSSTFPVGRALSNKIFSCIEEVLPAKYWKNLIRIAVATGPGGFTGTRISIVLGRTICEQINCPLDGFSSFSLMANRLHKSLNTKDKGKPFWIIKELPRRGTIGGKYQIISQKGEIDNSKLIEIERPHLLEKEINNQETILHAEEKVSRDVLELLELSKNRHMIKAESNWKDILPIYPTSPIKDNP